MPKKLPAYILVVVIGALAILIAAFFNFVLPIMLVQAAICLFAYAFLTRLR